MMKAFVILLWAITLVPCTALASDRPTIPPDVRYKFIDDKEDAAVRAALAAKFLKGETAVAELFQGPCILAPGYWKFIVDSGWVKKGIPGTFTVPNLKTGISSKLDGSTIKETEDLHLIAIRFASDVGKAPIIRRLTTAEISQVWAVVPFDMEEPIYVQKNGARHFLIMLLKDGTAGTYCVSWVDLLTEYNSTQQSKGRTKPSAAD